MMLKRSAIILVTCLLCSCGARPVIDNAKTSVRAEVYASPTAIPSESLTPTLPPSETSTETITPTSTVTPTPSATATITPTSTSSAAPSESPTKQTNNDATSSSAAEKINANFAKQKADVLKNNPDVSDIGIAGDLIAEVIKKIDSTDIVGSGRSYQQAKGIFRFLYIRVMNIGKKAKTIDSSMFTLESPDGTSYEPDPTAAIYAKVSNSLSVEKINPGLEFSGYIVFDVPPDLKFRNLVLRVRNGLEHVDLKFRQP